MKKEHIQAIRGLFSILDSATFNGMNARKMTDYVTKMQEASKALHILEKEIDENIKIAESPIKNEEVKS